MLPLQMLKPPAAEPISLAELHSYLKLEDDADAARLASLVRTAREACELFLGIALIERQVRLRTTLSGPRFYLSGGPVRRLDALSHFIGADESVLDPASYPLCKGPVRVYLDLSSVPVGRVIQADYTLGLGPDWNAVPEAIRQGIMRLAAHQYEHRSNPAVAALPNAVTALWQPYRMVRI